MKNILVLVILLFINQGVFALGVYVPESAVKKLPVKPETPLVPYKDNYLLFASTRSDIKFQFSFQYKIFTSNKIKASIYKKFIKNIYFGYTQKSVWDTFRASAPFEDHNFNPELFWCSETKGCNNNLTATSKWKTQFRVGYEHESNGVNGGNSRSWNRFYIRTQFMKRIGDGSFVFAPKVWIVTSKDTSNNNDIEDYLGNFDAEFLYSTKKNINIGMNIRRGRKKGSLVLDLSMPLQRLGLFKNSKYDFNPDIYIQYFKGYGENLLTYKVEREVFRLGLRLFK